MLACTLRNNRWFPEIRCDACGKVIERLDQGIVQLHLDGSMRIVHKTFGYEQNVCDDRTNNVWWMTLEVFLHHLLVGIHFDSKHAKQEAEHWNLLG